MLLAVAIVMTFQNFIDKQQTVNNNTIKAIAINTLIQNDVKPFAKILRKTNHYQLLMIANKNNEKLYHYENESNNVIGHLFSANIIKVELPSITITYQLSIGHLSSLILNLFVYLFILASVIVLLLSIFTRKQYLLLFENITALINKEVNLVNNKHTPAINEKSPKVTFIPELQQGLEKIKTLAIHTQKKSMHSKEDAYIDHITQLPNRNSFIASFQENILAEHNIESGVLIITRCTALQAINKLNGYTKGDEYICDVVHIINQVAKSQKNTAVYRLNSSDFASVIPNISLDEAEAYAQKLTRHFNDYQQGIEQNSIAYTGLVCFQQNDILGELLALADAAISLAQSKQVNTWYSQKNTELLNDDSAAQGNQHWQQDIKEVLAAEHVHLLLQPIQSNKNHTPLYSEVLARFTNKQGEALPTELFISMAEKLTFIVAIDQMIITTLINTIHTKKLYQQFFGININAHSILDDNFILWLERLLLKEQNIAPQFIFEMTELASQQNIKVTKRFIDMIHSVKARITIERFGIGLTSFKVFSELKPNFIKMNTNYTRDILHSESDQQFIKAMVELAHSLNIKVLAQCIENIEEKSILSTLSVDGYQGYFIDKPYKI